MECMRQDGLHDIISIAFREKQKKEESIMMLRHPSNTIVVGTISSSHIFSSRNLSFQGYKLHSINMKIS